MTNVEIIMHERLIHGIKEDLNTFLEWKRLGYRIKKGEKAVVQTKLWKKVKHKVRLEDDQEEVQSKFVLVPAYLFTRSQVQKL